MDFSKNAFVAIGDNDKREKFENVTLGECDEIKIGMQVRSEEEAYNFYNEYALKKGFSIRKAINIVNSKCWTFFFFFKFSYRWGEGDLFFCFSRGELYKCVYKKTFRSMASSFCV